MKVHWFLHIKKVTFETSADIEYGHFIKSQSRNNYDGLALIMSKRWPTTESIRDDRKRIWNRRF